jgi:hypothetical protein
MKRIASAVIAASLCALMPCVLETRLASQTSGDMLPAPPSMPPVGLMHGVPKDYPVILGPIEIRSEGGGDFQVSGTMTIETDWSSFDVVAESRTTRTSGSEEDQIQIVIDTGWSFDLSRKMVKQ